MKIPIIILVSTIFLSGSNYQENAYVSVSGRVSFISEATQELIKGHSDELKGVIDPSKKTFAFSVRVSTFEGFNSPLQREHFNESYLESDKYPLTIFKGKIIEDIDFNTDGSHLVRAKGMFTIHGIEQEKIIKSTVVIKNNSISINSRFFISLRDYNIRIPRVVHDKIATDILVEVKVEFLKNK